MALNTAAIATAISELDLTGISGVRIRDLDEIPVNVEDRDCPIMYPSPEGLIGGYAGGPQTFTVAGAYWEITRVLRYIFLQAKLGTDRALSFSHHKAMVANADALIEKLAELNVSGVDVIEITIGAFGPMFAPGDLEASCHGFEVLITVRERLNA